MNYSGVRWASRFPHLWIVEAVYQAQVYAPGPLRFHSSAQMGQAERYLNDAVYEDLSRHQPDVLLVLRHARDVQGNAIRRVDYVGYFTRDARIARELRRYRFAQEVGQYLLYVRARSPDQPGTPPSPSEGRYDVVRSATTEGAEGAHGGPRVFIEHPRVCSARRVGVPAGAKVSLQGPPGAKVRQEPA